MCVLLFDFFNGCSTSVKEINRQSNVRSFRDVFNGCSQALSQEFLRAGEVSEN